VVPQNRLTQIEEEHQAYQVQWLKIHYITKRTVNTKRRQFLTKDVNMIKACQVHKSGQNSITKVLEFDNRDTKTNHVKSTKVLEFDNKDTTTNHVKSTN
ncbi:hypothetical protein Leryth_004603, partial [Lithospermum erythrorhizon]